MFFLSGWESKVDKEFVEQWASVETSMIGNILNIVRIYGTGLALIMLTWMSISYFTADGRSFRGAMERKAEIKGAQLKNFAIGVAVFIGASNILYFIATFIEDLFLGK